MPDVLEFHPSMSLPFVKMHFDENSWHHMFYTGPVIMSYRQRRQQLDFYIDLIINNIIISHEFCYLCKNSAVKSNIAMFFHIWSHKGIFIWFDWTDMRRIRPEQNIYKSKRRTLWQMARSFILWPNKYCIAILYDLYRLFSPTL